MANTPRAELSKAFQDMLTKNPDYIAETVTTLQTLVVTILCSLKIQNKAATGSTDTSWIRRAV